MAQGFNLESTGNQYQTILQAANDRIAKLSGKPYGDNPLIKAGWEGERERMLQGAAGLILEKVGKATPEELKEAVAPEDLKQVLLKAGAGLDKLMQAGVGKEELRYWTAKRSGRLRI
ncbi:MAG: hypothetical protein PHW63_10745 [Alphaproteobacteria bacterium]|nr:hypothetical protein [Alphaproteobacteria bacterium]